MRNMPYFTKSTSFGPFRPFSRVGFLPKARPQAGVWRLVLPSALVCSFVGFLGGHASAQDMSFGVDEVHPDSSSQATAQGPIPEAVQPAPATEALEALQRQIQSGRYAEAAMALFDITQSRRKADREQRPRAQFLLGQALYEQGFYQSALVVFDDISHTGPSHPFYRDALRWLATLATELPEAAGIVEKVGRYDARIIEDLNTDQDRELYNQLLYLLGRNAYQTGDLQAAIPLFQKVQRGTRFYLEALFFEGTTHIRLRKAQPAVRSFRRILKEVEKPDVHPEVDKSRMENLARISLARIYYSAANTGSAAAGGESSIDGALIGNAVDMWSKVSISSEYWLDSQFEDAWALFLADEYSRALGNAHTLYSPYFADSYYPEALVIKAVTFFMNCLWENAEQTVRDFHRRYDPVQTELNALLQGLADNQAFFDFLVAVGKGQANLADEVRGIVRTALSDRTLLNHMEYVRLLDLEQATLEQADPALMNSDLGGQILQDVAIARVFAVDATGDLARARYDRLVTELQELMNQIDTVELEITTARRDELDSDLEDQMNELARRRGGDVKVDEEHQVWRFDGEYWRDELGFYRQQVTYQCGR